MGLIQTESQILKQSNSLCLTAKDVLPLVNDIAAINDKIITPIPLPYSRYVALLTQSGTDNPVVNVLENELAPSIITWTRVSEGIFAGKLSAGTFNPLKTFILVSENNPRSNIFVNIESAVVIMHVYADGNPQDSLVNNVPIEIRVYK